MKFFFTQKQSRNAGRFFMIPMLLLFILFVVSCEKDEIIPVVVRPGGCDTTNVLYQRDVKPTLEANCISCHSSGNAQGGVNLEDYVSTKKAADEQNLAGSVTPPHGSMVQFLPSGDTCSYRQIIAWVNQGAKNN